MASPHHHAKISFSLVIELYILNSTRSSAIVAAVVCNTQPEILISYCFYHCITSSPPQPLVFKKEWAKSSFRHFSSLLARTLVLNFRTVYLNLHWDLTLLVAILLLWFSIFLR
ncbi:hypothetical protein P8452_07136 [Trifolium repens]|nr:hypothetical protein P8452_07136 [Trifolium repens]